jgi:magnesium chelatase accessory protein
LADSTGSRLSPKGVDLYRLLVASPGHLAAALNMMANWDLAPLQQALPQLKPRLILVAFTNDKSVPPAEAERAHALMPTARLLTVGGFGHLAHEEDPDAIAELVFDCVGDCLPTPAAA